MAAGEDHLNREDVVYSEKIITEDSEKSETYQHDEKNVLDGGEHSDEFWLKDSKDTKNDGEGLDFLSTEDELDIAIINDIAITEDDTSLKSLTVRSVLTGFVST